MQHWLRFGAAIGIVLLGGSEVLPATSSADQCQAQKLTATGKYTLCRLRAEARAVKRGTTADFGRCDSRLASKYARIDARFGDACPWVGDLEKIRADATGFTDGVNASTAGSFFCSDDRDRIETDSPAFVPGPSGPTDLGGGVLQLNEAIYQASGFGNTFMVVTSEGNVIIDTSLFLFAPAHEAALRAIDSGPVKYVILTHAHADHTGGVDLWKEPGTEVIAHRNHAPFVHYQTRLAGIFNHRNTAQFSLLLGLPPLGFSPPDAPVVNYGGNVQATLTFDQFCEFRLGGLTFQIMYTPGETYDGLTVWIPEYKAAFVGDNFYELSFPNMYTLRGTRPRWALDYVESLEEVMSWGPELLAPSHLNPIYGSTEIGNKLSKYRDAILYVHDETVRGMNAGKSPETLMDEVVLPPELEHGEGYGTVPWSVHGIYDGYVGFFDENPATMFPTAPRDAYPELATLAGGPGPVATRAAQLVAAGDYPLAIRMTDVALAVDPDHLPALQARLDALQALFAASVNVNEQGWLNTWILETQDRIADASP